MTESLVRHPPRPFSLGIYVVIVFGVSWPPQIVAPFLAHGGYTGYILNASSMLMVTVGTLLAGLLIFRDGFAQAGWRWGTARQLATAVGLVLLLWVAPTVVARLLGVVHFPDHLTAEQVVNLFIKLVVTLLPAFGEEFGWRGYLLPHLAERVAPRKAVLLHGVVFWAWHFPFVIGMAMQLGAKSATAYGLPVGLSVAVSVAALTTLSFIPTVLHGVLFAYLWTRSRSLMVVTIYHALFDGVRDSLPVLNLFTQAAGLWANAVLVGIGAVLLWKGNWSSLACLRATPATSTGPSRIPGVPSLADRSGRGGA